MDKLQFLIFIFVVLLPNLCNVLLCNYRIYLSSFSILKLFQNAGCSLSWIFEIQFFNGQGIHFASPY